jgi:sugar phosphate isomerase/epimerase
MSSSLPSRRNFIRNVTGAAALLAARRLRADAIKPAPASTGGEGPAVVHVFAKPLQIFSYAATADLVATAGLGGVDFAVRPGGHVAPERVEDELPRAVAAARAAGLRVDTITTGITRADETARRLLACAAGLGIRHYRLGNFTYDRRLGPAATLDQLRPQLRDLAALNESTGLHGAIQNHTGTWRVGAAGWDLHALLRDLDPRWLGCQYDIRHATAVSGTSWPVTLDLLAPWIRSIVLKDFRWQQTPGAQQVEDLPLGEGIVDLAAFLRRVRELGLSATWSLHLEYAPFEHGPQRPPAEARPLFLDAMRRDVGVLRQAVARAGFPGK